MKFGEFFVLVCRYLREQHGWKAPGRYLVDHPELIDVIYDEYEVAGKSPMTALADLIARKVEFASSIVCTDHQDRQDDA